MRFSKLEFKRFFYFTRFNSLPYKDHFFFRNQAYISKIFKNLIFYIYSGKFFFKLKINKWMNGFSVKYYIWPKQPAIYKKKQTLKKKKK